MVKRGMGMAVRCCASFSNNIVNPSIFETTRFCCCINKVIIMYTYTARLSLTTMYKKARIESSLADLVHNNLFRGIVYPIAVLLSVQVPRKFSST